jgi:hypothetical protein
MHVFKARVIDGHLTLKEPTDLPEGTELELVLTDDADEMSPELRAALERSVEQMKAGQLIDGDEVHRKLRALRHR